MDRAEDLTRSRKHSLETLTYNDMKERGCGTLGSGVVGLIPGYEVDPK